MKTLGEILPEWEKAEGQRRLAESTSPAAEAAFKKVRDRDAAKVDAVYTDEELAQHEADDEGEDE